MKNTTLNEVLYDQLGRHDLYLDEEELDTINNAILQHYINEQNKGIMLERCETNDREKAFMLEWYEANKIKSYMNFGYGLLQDLFVDQDKHRIKRLHYVITQNDRAIVATVIQWLGTNIGLSFLESALKRCGYKLVKQ